MDSELGTSQGIYRPQFSHLESQLSVVGGNADPIETDTKSDVLNYALLIVLYTLQGIPMGLSASIPFLIQQKVQGVLAAATHDSEHHASASAMAYNANAVFALCSWPFSLKLLWAPIVDACYLRQFGRRKSWLVPVQLLAGMLMVGGSNFVETQLGISSITDHANTNVTAITAFFFALYFLMATQDIAVDGWALTMLTKKNRGRGPVCNSIGQNIGYFISFVGFLALNDAESCETLWRPLLRLPSQPGRGLVSLEGFLRSMGYFMILTTTIVALFKREVRPSARSGKKVEDRIKDDEAPHELDASEIGLKETYHRLWAVCKLPSVQWLFVILFTYRLPTSLTDNVKVRIRSMLALSHLFSCVTDSFSKL